jgi:hypothetical protein
MRKAAEEKERVQRYTGSTACNEDGGRLDRREFKETQAALHKLATCQAGWYRNQGKRYRPELLQRLGDDLTKDELPAPSGITMRVSTDGQAWYAWRQTVTGWYFGIGSNGPAFNEWRYDGPTEPSGFPRHASTWIEHDPSSPGSPNWT